MAESACTFPNTIVTASCMDCDREFTGSLAVRFIDVPGGPCLEVVVVDPKRNEAHPIARVQVALVPTVCPTLPWNVRGYSS